MTQTWQNTLRIAQLNAENLFLFLDQPPSDLSSLTEKQWQALSHASVPNKSLAKTQWLGEALKDINADIVLMNEVGGLESLSNFSRYFLGDQYQPLLVEGNSDRGIDIGYLVRRTLPLRFELVSHKNRPLQFLYPHEIDSNKHFAQAAPEKVIKTHYFSRDCAELRVYREGETAPSLIILLVHLKSKLDPESIDPEGRLRRGAELRVLIDIYNEVRARFQVPVLVGGDFNGNARRDSRSPEFEPVKQTDWRNALELLNLSPEESCTQIQFARSGSVGYLQIDYLMISPDLEEHLIPRESGVYRYKSDLKVPLALPVNIDQRLQLPSDHYPVFATFKNFLLGSRD